MRRTLWMIVAALGIAGCSSGGGATLDVDARWQLRCPADAPGCLTSRPAHAVDGLDGDPGILASCSVEDIGNGRRALNVLLEDATGSLELQNVILNANGGVQATAGCDVRLTESGVVFSDLHCGPELPSASQPCQISTVSIDEGAAGGPTLSTTVLCREIQDDGASETRDLVSPDAPAPADMPAPIKIIHCEGV